MSQPPASEDSMARGILTDGQRQALRDEDMDSNNRSTHVARIKQQLDSLHEDARILREHAPELYEQAREAVCEEELDERVQRLEQEVESLRAQLDDDED